MGCVFICLKTLAQVFELITLMAVEDVETAVHQRGGIMSAPKKNEKRYIRGRKRRAGIFRRIHL
jgi:hypothetical protein